MRLASRGTFCRIREPQHWSQEANGREPRSSHFRLVTGSAYGLVAQQSSGEPMKNREWHKVKHTRLHAFSRVVVAKRAFDFYDMNDESSVQDGHCKAR
ncbi:uncharacterized protein PSANT_02333 [Moesziomyces antarcticus]|uniref:Uncharacterized protein n=1 Tax=Pseudozyma antarctica TaxID=84753 RepID=A0A5C3FJV9_PSEA2|nr:uncharacterized protein PSANT_02333 [Moesziomyces antarcticus]